MPHEATAAASTGTPPWLLAAAVTWSPDRTGLVLGSASAGPFRCHLTAERAPGGSSWLAWPVGSAAECLHGVADTLDDAMIAAERAADRLASAADGIGCPPSRGAETG